MRPETTVGSRERSMILFKVSMLVSARILLSTDDGEVVQPMLDAEEMVNITGR